MNALITRRATWVLVVALVARERAAAAQSPAQRHALELFRDSLQLTIDTIPLHQWEADMIAVARVDRDEAMLHLRLGFIALRIHTLTGVRGRVDDAAGEFEWATQLQPGWPYPWFGLGLAEAAGPDRARGFAGGLYTMLGIDRDALAGHDFLRALQDDPGFTDGLIAFAETARTERLHAPVQAALTALREVERSPIGWDPGLLLERGRLERLAGNPDSAVAAFARAARLAPDPAMAQLELARTLALTATGRSDTSGSAVAAAYFAAAESDAADVVALLRRDLQPIATDAEMAQFDSRSGAARVAWLASFWRESAARDLRAPGARLAEHYRRWNYVLQHFRLPPFTRSYRWGIEPFQSHDGELDDRGIVWLRQGPPARRIIWPASLPRVQLAAASEPAAIPFDTMEGLIGERQRRPSIFEHAPPRPGSLIIDPPVGETPSFGNETWRYVTPDGDLVLNFAAQDDPDDYRLVENIMDLDVSYDILAANSGEVPGLADLLRSGPVTRGMLAQEERLRERRSIATATTTTSWARRYPHRFAAAAIWLTAGVRHGAPLVHLIYAIDAAALDQLPVDSVTGRVPLRVRAVMIDRRGHVTGSLDTLQWLAPPGPGTGAVAARAEMPAAPGAGQVRLNLEAGPGVGVVFPMDTLMVPDVSGRSAAISTIVLGTRRNALPWPIAHGDTVWIGVQNEFASGDTVGVFAQAYGLHPGSTYVVRLSMIRHRSAIGRLWHHHADAVTMSESVVPQSETLDFRRGLALGELPSGRYQVALEIDGDGQRIQGSRTIRIGAVSP